MLFLDTKSIDSATHSVASLVQDMGVNHGVADVFMPRQFLKYPDVISRFSCPVKT